MILHFVGGSTSQVVVEKETKKFIYIYCKSNTMRYRVNKQTGEVQGNTYHDTIKGMFVE